MFEHTFIGLDVHAVNVVGHALNPATGEISNRTMPADPAMVLERVFGLIGFQGHRLAGSFALEWRRSGALTGSGFDPFSDVPGCRRGREDGQ
ncbi:hypothetical protein ABIB17_001924 [Arthrobacter sp. UYEF6]